MFRECQIEQEHFRLVFSLAGAPEIDYFVGRASNLSSIESILLPLTAAERKVVVLHGLGGIGKSQLAIEFAKKHRSDYTAVLWLNAKTEETLKRSFAANARRLPKKYFNQEILYGPQNEEVLSLILREMKAWLHLPGNHRWLLIYDNVDNPKIPDNKRQNAYDVRPYFPEAHQGSILVTTRWKTLRIGHPLEVAKLSKDEESISLLEQISGRNIGQGKSKNHEAFGPTLVLGTDLGTKDLLKKLDGLPLALATTGAYLGLTSMSVSEYLHHHETSWLELQRTSPKLLSYEDQTIYSTWNLSYIHIRKEDESAAKLIELWAYFDNQDLWYDLLKAGNLKGAPVWVANIVGTKLAFQAAIVKLQKHALVESLTDSDGYAMHHCVHAWVRNVLCPAVEDQNMILALDCVGKRVPFDPEPGDWLIKQRLSAHSERCLQLLLVWIDEGKYSKGMGDHVTSFLGRLGILYRDQGKLTKAESVIHLVLTRYEKNRGPNDLNILSTVNNLGNLYRNQGKLSEAESLYQRALAGYEEVLGPNHSSTLETVNNLGGLYSDQGKLSEAELMYQRALAGFEKVLGQDHTSTLMTFSNLGILYKHQGKLAEVESMYQRALLGYTRNPPANPKSQLELFYNMGCLSRKTQDFERAKEYFNKAYQGYHELWGSQHPKAIDALEKLRLDIEREMQGAEDQDRE